MAKEYVNKKAKAFYDVLETFEAGIVLKGPEVKALRMGKVDFKGSYVTVRGKGAVVRKLNIGKYPKARQPDYDPKRERELLLKKREISKLRGLEGQKGVTLIPLRVYFKNNVAKLEIGVAKGKSKRDRRRELKRKAQERDVEVELRGKT